MVVDVMAYNAASCNLPKRTCRGRVLPEIEGHLTQILTACELQLQRRRLQAAPRPIPPPCLLPDTPDRHQQLLLARLLVWALHWAMLSHDVGLFSSFGLDAGEAGAEQPSHVVNGSTSCKECCPDAEPARANAGAGLASAVHA